MYMHIYVYVIYVYAYLCVCTCIYRVWCADSHTDAREAFWRRVFDPYAPLVFNLYHYLEQTLHFGLVPENQF